MPVRTAKFQHSTPSLNFENLKQFKFQIPISHYGCIKFPQICCNVKYASAASCCSKEAATQTAGCGWPCCRPSAGCSGCSCRVWGSCSAGAAGGQQCVLCAAVRTTVAKQWLLLAESHRQWLGVEGYCWAPLPQGAGPARCRGSKVVACLSFVMNACV